MLELTALNDRRLPCKIIEYTLIGIMGVGSSGAMAVWAVVAVSGLMSSSASLAAVLSDTVTCGTLWSMLSSSSAG